MQVRHAGVACSATCMAVPLSGASCATGNVGDVCDGLLTQRDGATALKACLVAAMPPNAP